MCFLESDISLHHFDMIYLSVSDSYRNIYTISQYPKLTITTGAQLWYSRNFYSISPRDTTMIHVLGHITLGGGAYSLKLPIYFISSQSKNASQREQTSRSASLPFSQQRTEHFFYQSRRSHQKQFPTYPTPTLPTTTIPSTSPHFSMNSFDYLLRCLSSRYCQTP